MINTMLNRMIVYNAGDPMRIQHSVKVFAFAQNIARNEQCSENLVFTLSMAAILHDIGIRNAEEKYHSSAGNYQEREGPPVAEKLMEDLTMEKSVKDRILYLIGNHHTYTNINGIDYQILIEADFLVNIFEDRLHKESIDSIKKNIFRTTAGITLLDTLYYNGGS
ncbi:MAG TPA: HD domain-containing protein [Treponemataceae bacterium]|mgnify:FL=1|nr:HD domain-containing protein [Treponemataceae bacterium]HOS35612.1 HD domain-containing protein [Treponemataceae bacterium]HOU39371.1 HD domain-containing protein [Treponemataceae bacterium]HPL91761.1 HD domain-containing protein [Treponemataceae bacterium]HQF74195.1 HD domain-containing protein [Treponemataceae bacterium]